MTESATLGRTPGFTPHQGLRELRLEVSFMFDRLCWDNSHVDIVSNYLVNHQCTALVILTSDTHDISNNCIFLT